MTTAPPVMSRFMLTIASAGLIDRPPVSKVMPLPTSTTWRCLAALALPGCSRARISRGGVAEAWPTPRMPPKPLGLEPLSSHTVSARPVSSASATAWSASQGGFLTLEGTVARHPRPPAGAADRDRTVQRPARPVVGDAGEHDPAQPAGAPVALGAPGGSANDPSIAPTTNASRPSVGRQRRDRRRDRVAVAGGPGQRRAGAAEVVRAAARRPRPAAPSGARHSRGRPAAPGPTVTSPALPVAVVSSRTPSRSMPELVADLGGAGAEQHGVAVGVTGRTGTATASTPTDGVRAQAR